MRTHACASILLLSACTSLSADPNARFSAPAGPAADPVIEVHNDHDLAVQIHLIWSGTRYYLGDVAPDRADTFRVPRELVADGWIQLLADPIGSTGEYLTSPVRLGDGRHVEWRLRKHLDGSRLRIL